MDLRSLQQANGTDKVVRNLKLLRDPGELCIKHIGKTEQPVTLPPKGDVHRTDSGGIQVLPRFQFVDDEIKEFPTILKTGSRQRQDIPFQPDDQGFDILGQFQRTGLGVTRFR
ncbi:MAG: hypothetical protein ACXWAT_01500 [Methylobacter sp.]